MTEQEYTEFVRGLESHAAHEADFSIRESRLLHGVLGLVTESAELADAIKKRLAYGKPIDQVNLSEELGDIEWYLSLIRDAYGLSREEIIEANVYKLQSRYPGGWTQHRALNRDLEAERAALEDARLD
jgi:NTP pyrophosphatase (non-canonical NTP hydrolase)